MTDMTEIESFRCKIVTFEEISKWTLDVSRQVGDSGYSPTVIIGLTRGGWVPARLLCDHLQVKKLYAVKTEHWGVTANQNGKALLTQELNASIENENVLIVDDITDTGESLELATSHVRAMGPKEIKTCTLLHITHSRTEPDFYSVKVPKEVWTWFIFPWNLHEDMRTLLPKTLYQGRTEQEIVTAFKDQFQIDISEDLARTTLKDLEAIGKVKRTGRYWVKT
ncbi:MAG: phosphoribosyltransferase [Methanomassiliicoccales archaeon]|nr:MAG: phosphoribosyltransferase [Methanomassiliicoccales archaeon]